MRLEFEVDDEVLALKSKLIPLSKCPSQSENGKNSSVDCIDFPRSVKEQNLRQSGQMGAAEILLRSGSCRNLQRLVSRKEKSSPCTSSSGSYEYNNPYNRI